MQHRQPFAAAGDAAAVTERVARARAAQAIYAGYDQDAVDEVVTAAAWAIVEPDHNRQLAEIAVRDTGMGRVEDKMEKNLRKTLGLLRDLRGAKSVGIIAEHPERGIVEIARPVGVVAAITPSTHPVAAVANKVMNALKGRNAVIVSPSPKGASSCALAIAFIRAELERVGAPRDLVQMLPTPVSKALTQALMAQADLIVATGSQNNVRAALASGTPAIGVGRGNVAVIVDADADIADAARKIAASKTFDNATSCSSENHLVVLERVYAGLLQALCAAGGSLLDEEEKRRLAAVLWQDGQLSRQLVGRSAPEIAARAGLDRKALASARFLLVEETGIGPAHPFSGEKLCPVLTIYRVPDMDAAIDRVARLYAYQGAGHAVGLFSRSGAAALRLAESVAATRVILNQAMCHANGGSLENGLPFSLSLGCGTWGGNLLSENVTYRHYLNITRVVWPIPRRGADMEDLFGKYWRKHAIAAAPGRQQTGLSV